MIIWELGIGNWASGIGCLLFLPSSLFLLAELRYIRYIRPYESVAELASAVNQPSST
ncbi:hypothetical protein [Microcoleus sp.]|uniref:hypothetical protein n=1 Tax=Microcoleus sp. TaxID=44472 RepID=UPI003593E81C